MGTRNRKAESKKRYRQKNRPGRNRARIIIKLLHEQKKLLLTHLSRQIDRNDLRIQYLLSENEAPVWSKVAGAVAGIAIAILGIWFFG
jgi:hypothetical protein